MLTLNPLERPHSEVNGARDGVLRSTPEDDNSMIPLHILIADADPAMVAFYQECLPRRGHQLCTARTGPQLIEQCRLLSPDLVVADVQLPDLDGVAAAWTVCQHRPVPFILVSSGHDADCFLRASDSPHVLGCLVKPFTEAALEAAIAVAVRHFYQVKALRQEAAGLRQALEERKVIERAKGLVSKYCELSEQDAYDCLRKLASCQNRRLTEVAQSVLAAGEVFQILEQTPSLAQRPNGDRGHSGNDEKARRAVKSV